MKKNYFKTAVAAMMLLSAQSSMAVVFPYAQTPVEGGTYILASRTNPTNYWSRTSWDGAYYYLSLQDSHYADNAFVAHQAEDGSWYFEVNNGEEGRTFGGNTYYDITYVGIPNGTCNINAALYEPAYWTLEVSDVSGFYLLKAGAGHGNEYVENGYLHQNGGNQYPIINEPMYGGQWYPDYYLGVQRDENGDPVLDEWGFLVPNNPASRYWAFLAVDDVPAYSVKIELYALLQDIEDNHLQEEGFADGFKGAYDATLPYYEKEDFTADDLAAAQAIINAKMNLYKEIISATDLLANGTPSTLLAEAIEKATQTFNATNDPDVLQAATQELKDAVKAYASGSDDLTLLIENNSFEDLSSQNGSMTSSVSGAPTGWNVFINGKQVVTADEVRAAGIGAWHGINDDAEGAKDGNYAFGIWNGGIPEYEISQTITGLENGSYTVAAAVMVGANGGGSRRTTQRLFGNLNAKYFGADYEYNEELLDKGEIYGFEGLEEPVTDRLLQEMTVRAFVYDGTLTFGLRTNGNIAAANRESGNGAGGDGWFKLDNFRIYKEGYVQDDALAIYDHFAALYDGMGWMQKSIREQLDQLLEGSIGAGSSQQEIIDAIVKLKDMYPIAKASVDAYVRLDETIQKGSAITIDYPNGMAAEELGDMLMEAQDMYNNAEAGVDEINDMIAQINEAIELVKANAITIGDITYAIKNPSFEDLSNQNNSPSDGAQPAPYGWTLKMNGEVVETIGPNWCAINHGDNISVMLDDGTEITHQYTDGEYLWGIWTSNIPEVELSQTLTHLPKGAYTVQADVMVQYNWAGDCTTTQRIFGNKNVQMWGTEDAYSELNMPADALNANVLTYAGWVCAQGQDGIYNSDLLHPMSVQFDVDDDGIAVSGFRTNGVNAEGLTFADGGLNGQGWFKVDNFRLSYDSEEMLGIEGVSENAHSSQTATFYTIDGRRLQAPQRGLNIVTMGGKSHKVIVK